MAKTKEQKREANRKYYLASKVKKAGFNLRPDPTIYESVEKILEPVGLYVPKSLQSDLKKGHLLSHVCNNKNNRLRQHFRDDNTEEELLILDAVIVARRIVLEVFGVLLQLHHMIPRCYKEEFDNVDNVNSLYPVPWNLHGMCGTRMLTPEVFDAQAKAFLTGEHAMIQPGDIPTWWKCVSGMDFVKLVGEAVSLKVESNPM